jgi:diphthamide biosynthesis protein 2
MHSVQNTFDLVSACAIIVQHKYTRIALQFTEETLHMSVSSYKQLKALLAASLTNNPSAPSIAHHLYIITDSTYGNSIDDISAAHIGAHLLVYFGNDLNTSCSIPLLILPLRKCIHDQTSFRTDIASIISHNPSVIACIDLAYYSSTMELIGGEHAPLTVAQLPSYADPSCWRETSAHIDSHLTLVGGLYVPSAKLTDSSVIVYIGSKANQLLSIQLKLSTHLIKHYSPESNVWSDLSSSTTKEYQQRYGGIARVEAARIVGIVIGSMGLTAELTKTITERIQRLVLASGRQFYTFVMGRLNEAKLCNFPEVVLEPSITSHPQSSNMYWL